MAEGLFENVYNPDVLSCLANLSNDEVFTPPDVVNEMLDMLPQELFSDPDTTFLDPACKTGVFLRETAKRLIKGLEPQFPDLQERIDHIFHKQLFGIAITELTSLLSRRGLYCSKYPNSNYSVSRFDDAQGNIRFKRISHKWEKGKCVYCGASESQYERGDELETHAYEWIHTIKPEEIFNMKFDVIISNPPYQLSTGGSKAQAIPLYDKFVMQAKKLKPRYMTMIIPARWYAGGMGLDSFREKMLNDNSIRKVVDYPNSKDCFPGVSIGGGVCYFLWDRDNKGECEFTNIHNNNISKMNRKMSEFPVFVRYNEAISIIRKVQSMDVVIEESEKYEITDVALNYFGKAAFYAPTDEDGFFINKTVAKYLQNDKSEHALSGYYTESFNSRGVYSVDPTGKAEFSIEMEYRDKAKAAEACGMIRFASTLRSIADTYHEEGEENIKEHKLLSEQYSEEP